MLYLMFLSFSFQINSDNLDSCSYARLLKDLTWFLYLDLNGPAAIPKYTFSVGVTHFVGILGSPELSDSTVPGKLCQRSCRDHLEGTCWDFGNYMGHIASIAGVEES